MANMKNRVFIFSVIYSLICIISVCVVFYLGNVRLLNLTYLFTLVAMLPMMLLLVKQTRDKDLEGFIEGNQAMKTGLKFVAFSALILAGFQIVFYYSDFRDFKINYIMSVGPETLKKEIASGKLKAKESDIPLLLQKDIQQITLFAEVTAVLFKTFAYGLFCAFMCSVFLKRSKNQA